MNSLGQASTRAPHATARHVLILPSYLVYTASKGFIYYRLSAKCHEGRRQPQRQPGVQQVVITAAELFNRTLSPTSTTATQLLQSAWIDNHFKACRGSAIVQLLHCNPAWPWQAPVQTLPDYTQALPRCPCSLPSGSHALCCFCCLRELQASDGSTLSLPSLAGGQTTLHYGTGRALGRGGGQEDMFSTA